MLFVSNPIFKVQSIVHNLERTANACVLFQVSFPVQLLALNKTILFSTTQMGNGAVLSTSYRINVLFVFFVVEFFTMKIHVFAVELFRFIVIGWIFRPPSFCILWDFIPSLLLLLLNFFFSFFNFLLCNRFEYLFSFLFFSLCSIHVNNLIGHNNQHARLSRVYK